MAVSTPTNPALRRGYLTTEGLTTIGSLLAGWATNALILLDAVSVPEKYEALLVVGIALATGVQSAGYALGRGKAKAAAAGAIPEYLNALENSRVNSFNIELQEAAVARDAAARGATVFQTAGGAPYVEDGPVYYGTEGDPVVSPADPESVYGTDGDAVG
jgi:hypothetical protein